MSDAPIDVGSRSFLATTIKLYAQLCYRGHEEVSTTLLELLGDQE